MALIRPRRQHGNALILSMILLTVLSMMGAAAVALSSQERQNASAKVGRDMMTACAEAAQARIWAELVKYGPSYMGSTFPIQSITLPDGTQLAAPAHYPSAVGTDLVNSVVLTIADGAGGGTAIRPTDLTNRAGGLGPLGAVHAVVARCTDRSGRQFEVEFAIRLAL